MIPLFEQVIQLAMFPSMRDQNLAPVSLFWGIRGAPLTIYAVKCAGDVFASERTLFEFGGGVNVSGGINSRALFRRNRQRTFVQNVPGVTIRVRPKLPFCKSPARRSPVTK